MSLRERTLRNPSEGGPVGISSDDKIRWLPRPPSRLRPRFKIYVVYRPPLVPRSAWKRYVNRKIRLNKIMISFTFLDTKYILNATWTSFSEMTVQLQRRDIAWQSPKRRFSNHRKWKGWISYKGQARWSSYMAKTFCSPSFLKKGKGLEEIEFNILSIFLSIAIVSAYLCYF